MILYLSVSYVTMGFGTKCRGILRIITKTNGKQCSKSISTSNNSKNQTLLT